MERAVRWVLPFTLAVLPAAASAAERTLVLDPANSRVSFTLDTTFHRVHGTLALAGGTIRYDPGTGAASGEIVVDATRAETGNRRRDRTMHGEVLESDRFPTIVFRPERVEGAVAPGIRGTVRIAGILTLHGGEHPMTLLATVEDAGGRVAGELEMRIPYVDWGMKDPSFFVTRAARTVDVRVRAEGRWSETPAPDR
jgi:polyisoprenoid-binding protein YceI